MSLFARLMYRALVWKERKRTRWTSDAHGARAASGEPAHLKTGRRGETLAYWYLRQAGYTIVARNRRSHLRAGELDLIAWDGPVLSFVEVKTRTSAEGGAPEAAVSRSKQKRIAKTAREYLRRLGKRPVAYRFDIVSVLWDPKIGYHIRLILQGTEGRRQKAESRGNRKMRFDQRSRQADNRSKNKEDANCLN